MVVGSVVNGSVTVVEDSVTVGSVGSVLLVSLLDVVGSVVVLLPVPGSVVGSSTVVVVVPDVAKDGSRVPCIVPDTRTSKLAWAVPAKATIVRPATTRMIPILFFGHLTQLLRCAALAAPNSVTTEPISQRQRMPSASEPRPTQLLK